MYQVCVKTVMDSSDPTIRFDKNGISNHYWDFEKNIKPIWIRASNSNSGLSEIVKTLKEYGKDREFDCIIGLSGGLDSTYLVHKMVKDHGIRPLVFHVDGGWNTEVAVSNIHNLVDKLKLDLFTEVIDWIEMRDFQLAMFKSGVPHIDIPQDLAFIGVLYKFAEKHGIKYILNGGNISTECVALPLELMYWGTDMFQIKDILRKFGTVPMKTYPFSSIFYHKIYLRYFRGYQVLKPLNYINFNKTQAINELKNLYSWKPYPQKHFESRFTRFFEGYWLPTRFGFDMRRPQLSSLILTGQITREHALDILKQPQFDQRTVDKEFEYVATKLAITKEELQMYHEMEKKSYKNYKNIKGIFDIGEKVLSAMTGTRRGGAC